VDTTKKLVGLVTGVGREIMGIKVREGTDVAEAEVTTAAMVNVEQCVCPLYKILFMHHSDDGSSQLLRHLGSLILLGR
jgi:methyl coenzyme M reductase subunit C-like uncharacterized protein (methanogenesis marker protein 7)